MIIPGLSNCCLKLMIVLGKCKHIMVYKTAVIFFFLAEKMLVAFAWQKLLTYFQQKY